MPKRAGVTITPEAHTALLGIAGLASGLAERPVTISQAIIAALPVLRSHPAELRAALTGPDTGGTP